MARRSRKWPRRLLVIAIVSIVLLIGIRFYPPFRHPIDSVLLIQALFVGEKKSWLSKWTSAPKRPSASIGNLELDLYMQGIGPTAKESRGCILLAHGMTDMGRRDPRLIAFSKSIARLGFAVVVPELPGMRRFRPDLEDIDRIVKSFLWMDKQFSLSNRRCGMFSFSFAAGPAMKAAVREQIASRVGFFIAVGAYLDLREVLRYLTTSGRGNVPAFPGGPPIRVGKWLFLRYNMTLLGLDGHEEEIKSIVKRKLENEEADILALKGQLPDQARKLLALMENHDLARFSALFEVQPEDLKARLREWSTREDISRTTMPIFFLHGRSDPFVPFTESVQLSKLAHQRKKDSGRVRLLITDGLSHVDPERRNTSPGFQEVYEAIRLVMFVSDVLTAMEGG